MSKYLQVTLLSCHVLSARQHLRIFEEILRLSRSRAFLHCGDTRGSLFWHQNLNMFQSQYATICKTSKIDQGQIKLWWLLQPSASCLAKYSKSIPIKPPHGLSAIDMDIHDDSGATHERLRQSYFFLSKKPTSVLGVEDDNQLWLVYPLCIHWTSFIIIIIVVVVVDVVVVVIVIVIILIICLFFVHLSFSSRIHSMNGGNTTDSILLTLE